MAIAGLRIGGVSGIFNGRHYRLGHFESPPYSDDAMRSVYHLREIEVYRLAHLRPTVSNDNSSPRLEVFLSHDWPTGVWQYGDTAALLRRKPFLRDDLTSGRLGSPPLMQILRLLRPARWFAAHLHTLFEAHVPGEDGAGDGTSFLALDKVLPGRSVGLSRIALPSCSSR
jgi:lariat debranching enzyme